MHTSHTSAETRFSTPSARYPRLRQTLLAVAIASVTATSAANLPPVASAPSPKSAKAIATPLNETGITLDATAAVYISRRNNQLHFWEVDESAGTVARRNSLAIEPLSDQTVVIQLGPQTKGLFFADNIRQDGDRYRIAFRGELADGKIALPLPQRAVDPLYAVAIPGDIVTVPPGDATLQGVLSAQTAIYQRAAQISQMQAEERDLFQADMQNEVVAFYETQISETPTGRNTLEAAYNGAETVRERLVRQASTDLVAVQAAVSKFTTFNAQQLGRFESSVSKCVAGERSRIDASLAALQAKLESHTDDENSTPALEQSITATEDGLVASEAAIAKCLGTAELEAFEPAAPLGEEGGAYPRLAASADALVATPEPAIEQWEETLVGRLQFQADRIETNPRLVRLSEYGSYFSEWASPQYTSESIDASSADPTARTEQRAGVSEKDGSVGTLSTGTFCGNESWNLEFNLGSVGIVLGTPWSDVVVTGNNPNIVFTFKGNDCVETHAGVDFVFTGPGSDKAFLGDDIDVALMGAGDDEAHGGAGNTVPVLGAVTFHLGNLIVGQGGNDRLFGGELSGDTGEDGAVDAQAYTDLILGDSLLFGHPAGGDVIVGENGVDFLFGQDANDSLSNAGPGGIVLVSGASVNLGSFFSGGNHNDAMTGSSTTGFGAIPTLGDTLIGGSGNDTVSAAGGADIVDGGIGNDIVSGGTGIDFLFGRDGNDSLTGDDDMDLITGRAGDDTIHGSNGLVDLLFGGIGSDKIYGDDGIDLIFGSSGADVIQGGDGVIDIIKGGTESDVINGNAGIDIVLADAGEDRVFGDEGLDLLLGGPGSDYMRGGDATDIILGQDNSQEREMLFGDGEIDLMFGGAGNDYMEGNGATDLMFGSGADDTMSGGQGIDIVSGDGGADAIKGNEDADLLLGMDGPDIVGGGTGNDLIIGGEGCDVLNGDEQGDLVIGGKGKDRINGGDGLNVLLGGTDTDYIVGGPNNDFIFGQDDADYADGGDAIDLITGGDGNDYLVGSSGADVTLAGSGDDFVRGDNDSDLSFGGDGNDTINGASGLDVTVGGEGNDTLNAGDNTDFTFGLKGDDQLRTVEGTNYAFGGKDNDRVDGYDPAASSSSSDPRDFLCGNDGNDTISGNSNHQRDFRLGGNGSNTKVWNQTLVPASLFSVSWTGNMNCL
ncbi:hypothetical protein [Tahibacter amnicola]|uniref:Ca2+-binding RTX toxin-like protein n=1 Tax=Tahibacter amnicola TaxID=2976241 RepID=A0ABY6B9C2_9GAMM|nr:hypothetical protein [Tahibacter amnicola]UXI66619.1 hypothetical protein N4264_17935 [Tahibacter amnicola]